MLLAKNTSAEVAFSLVRILIVGVAAVGAGVAVWGLYELRIAAASAEWPSAKGMIIESSIEFRSGTSDTNTRTRTAGTHHAVIRYEFSVHGATYTGNRVSFGDYGSSDSSHARSIASEYSEGNHVTVYYMPDKPEVAVLEPGAKWGAWAKPGGGLVIFMLGSLMFIILSRITGGIDTEPGEGGNSEHHGAEERTR